MTAPVGVLAVMDRALHFSKHGKAIDSDSLREASAAVAELIEVDRAYDAAKRKYDLVLHTNYKSGKSREWVEAVRVARDRVSEAEARRNAALARVQGGAA